MKKHYPCFSLEILPWAKEEMTKQVMIITFAMQNWFRKALNSSPLINWKRMTVLTACSPWWFACRNGPSKTNLPRQKELYGFQCNDQNFKVRHEQPSSRLFMGWSTEVVEGWQTVADVSYKSLLDDEPLWTGNLYCISLLCYVNCFANYFLL